MSETTDAPSALDAMERAQAFARRITAPRVPDEFIQELAVVIAFADTDAHKQGFSEGIEAAAHWHDEQAARHCKLAIGFRDYLADHNNIDDDDRREILKLAQEQTAHALRHQVYAKMIRGLAVAATIGDERPTGEIERPCRPAIHTDLIQPR
jgi:hypothetical protein